MYRILDRIFEVCNKEISLLDERITISTMTTGFFLVLFLCSQIIIFYEILPHIAISIGSLVFLFLMCCYFFLGILFELDSRKMLRNYGKPYHVVVPELLKKHRFIRILNSLILYLSPLFILILVISMSLKWAELFLYSLVLLALSGVLYSLSYLFSKRIAFEQDARGEV
jgi:hypothetical protein